MPARLWINAAGAIRQPQAHKEPVKKHLLLALFACAMNIGQFACRADVAAVAPQPNESLLSLLVNAATNTAAQAAAPVVAMTVNPKMNSAVDTISWMQAIGRTTTIGGVYTFLFNGEYGGGVAVAWQPIHVDVKARTRILFGPSLVTASTKYSTRELLEVTIATKVIDAAAVQKGFKAIPLIGQLPLDISEVSGFFGFGARIDADTSSGKAFERYLGASAGLTGIKWGQ